MKMNLPKFYLLSSLFRVKATKAQNCSKIQPYIPLKSNPQIPPLKFDRFN